MGQEVPFLCRNGRVTTITQRSSKLTSAHQACVHSRRRCSLTRHRCGEEETRKKHNSPAANLFVGMSGTSAVANVRTNRPSRHVCLLMLAVVIDDSHSRYSSHLRPPSTHFYHPPTARTSSRTDRLALARFIFKRMGWSGWEEGRGQLGEFSAMAACE